MHQNESPPVFKSWSSWYWLVAAILIFFIIAMWGLTQMYHNG